MSEQSTALAEQPAQQRLEELLDTFKDVDQCGPLLGMEQPAQQESVRRTDQQIVDQTEELAVWLLSWAFNRQPETLAPMRESHHPIAERCWAAACHIQEMLTATDPENAVAELDDSQQPAQQQEPVAWANPNDLKNFDMKVRTNGGPLHTVPLYTSPQPSKPWVGLVKEDWPLSPVCWTEDYKAGVAWAETKLREKNA